MTNEFQVEITDTFGGEANYCWCNRETFDVDENASDLSIVRKAKKLMGWNGLRCTTHNYGDMIELRPFGQCVVMFISYVDQYEEYYA